LPSNNSSEIEYLLSLMRRQIPGPFKGSMKILQRMLIFHHLVENAAAFLNSLPANEVEPELTEFLKAHSSFCIAHRQAVNSGFHNIVSTLNNNDIDFIIFKGIYLEKIVYPAETIRQYADHDLLVHPADLPRAEQLFMQQGFQLQDSLFNRFAIEICQQRGYPRALVHQKARYLQIDLHTRLSIAPGPRFLDFDDCWLNPLKVEIEGIQVKTLRPEPAFLHLCWHLLKHSFCRLLWLQDLKFFLRKYEVLDKAEFHQLIKRHQAEQVVAAALNLLTQVYGGASAMQAFLVQIGKSTFRKSRYFRLPDIFQPRREISARTRVLRDLSLIPSWKRRLKYLAQAAFPQPEAVESLSGKVKQRMHWRYLFSRIRTLAAAFIDFQRFKK